MRIPQPTPSLTDADVERIAHREFPDDGAVVLAILAEYGGESWHLEPERVRVAVLKLAAGSAEQVRHWIEQAKSDWRDVLSPAEYPLYTKKWFRMEKLPDEEHNRIVESDRAQYARWLERT